MPITVPFLIQNSLENIETSLNITSNQHFDIVLVYSYLQLINRIHVYALLGRCFQSYEHKNLAKNDRLKLKQD